MGNWVVNPYLQKKIAQRSMWLAYITLLVFQFISEPFHGAFPDSPVVRTLCCHCQGPGSIPAQKNKPKPNRCYQYFVTDLYLQRSEDWELAALLLFFFKSSILRCMYDSHKKVLPFFSFGPCHEACGILVPQPGIEPGWQWKLSPNHWTTREFPSSALLSVQFNEVWQMYAFI